MGFRVLIGLVALLVAGTAAYFSVLGIATLFSGSYYQVAIMASALEVGKIVATSFLYRYWNQTVKWLRTYLVTAVAVLMMITSIGIFGYLSAAYQENSLKFSQVSDQIQIVEQQRATIENELAKIESRISTLNQSRLSQEKRLPDMSRAAAKPIYDDIARAAEEIKGLTQRSQELQGLKFEKDNQLADKQKEVYQVKDIGTFKFIADAINQPLDTVVFAFICVLIVVFDPLAVGLVLAYNIVAYKTIIRPESDEDLQTSPVLAVGKVTTKH